MFEANNDYLIKSIQVLSYILIEETFDKQFSMSRPKILLPVLSVALICLAVLVLRRNKDSVPGLSISYPFNNALFPPEFPAPAFEWRSEPRDSSMWEVTLITATGAAK